MANQGKGYRQLPEVVDRTPENINAIISDIGASSLSDDTKQFAIGCIELSAWLPQAIKEKNITIRQLQKLLFGNQSKRKKKSKGTDDPSSEAHTPDSSTEDLPDDQDDDSSKNDDESKSDNFNRTAPSEKKPGHGRYSHERYKNATDVMLTVEGLEAGDLCPENCGGKLYAFKTGVFVRITGNPIGTVTKYHLNKLRCALCNLLITPQLPEGVTREKYDTLFKANLCLNKYYLGTPFYRQATLQSFLNFPLPASVQYELCEQVADQSYPAFHALEKVAAEAKLIHNDDTPVKILSIIKENQDNPDRKRTGMYTTGIVAETGEHTIALYYSGRRHAGENLENLLNKRAATSDNIIQMCDASTMNLPASFQVILCNCLDHGFRKFKDLIDYFPEPCGHILTELAKVYRIDEECRMLSAEDRLLYHQNKSLPILTGLNIFLDKQLDDRLVEPNSILGKAIRYMLRHWKELTQFVRVAGCPLSNAIAERLLKIPIRVRKAAMFYKTEHGAYVGGILTSLMQTAILAKENPIDYLVALQDNYQAVRKNPEHWLPWNYRATLARKDDSLAMAA